MNFTEVKNNLEKFSIEDLDISSMFRGGTTAKRTVYNIKGKILLHEEVFPYNFLKKPWERTIISGNFKEDINLPEGFYIENIYHAKGYGDIVTEKDYRFLGSLEKAFNLLTNNNINI